MSPIFLVYFGIAMFLPIILFVVLLKNANEKRNMRIFVYVTTVVLYGIAGYLSSGGSWGWVGWACLVGAVEATALCFMV